jgi:hypothetical protein
MKLERSGIQLTIREVLGANPTKVGRNQTHGKIRTLCGERRKEPAKDWEFRHRAGVECRISNACVFPMRHLCVVVEAGKDKDEYGNMLTADGVDLCAVDLPNESGLRRIYQQCPHRMKGDTKSVRLSSSNDDPPPSFLFSTLSFPSKFHPQHLPPSPGFVTITTITLA